MLLGTGHDQTSDWWALGVLLLGKLFFCGLVDVGAKVAK